MKSAIIFRAIWLAAGLALVLGAARDQILELIPQPRELPRFDGATGKPWFEGGFVKPEPNQDLAPGSRPAHIPAISSWLGSDAWQGHAETAWFKASRRTIHVGVAGYPQHAGCQLWAEFRDAAGHITRVVCPLQNPREEWDDWEIQRPADAIAVRFIGDDQATDFTGWVGFSHPYRAWPAVVPVAFQHLQVWTTLALASTLVWGPGLILLWCLENRRAATRPRGPGQMPVRPETRAVILLGVGPLALAVLGVLAWCASGVITPRVVSFVGVAAFWLASGVVLFRADVSCVLAPATGRTLALSALIAVAALSKSTYSTGPAGELYRGLISRNLTVGDRIDARYPFHIVQAAAHHLAPASAATERFFQPWTFFSRGPLAGLAATPVVLATGGEPPLTFPDQSWSPFDRYGFAAYRITLITLASEIIVALFLVLVPFVGEGWALIAAGLLALSPFGVHEVMFTWPKWSATTWVALSFAFAHARRAGAAGLALGVGFLFHPLALLWSPWIGCWCLGRTDRRSAAWISTGLRFAAGVAILVVPWMAIGAMTPHLPDTVLAGQGGFLRYWELADGSLGPRTKWWTARWMNFANTFLPLHLYLSDASYGHFRLNSAYETSGRLVKFAFVWWNSLPFGLGLGLWALSLEAMRRALKTLPAAAIIFVIGPAVFITLYWGMDPLGLMRECGHPLFVAMIGITCVVGARGGGWLRNVLCHRAVPWLQLPETCLMLWLTTLANSQPWTVHFNQLDGPTLAINGLALGAAAWILSRGRESIEPAAPGFKRISEDGLHEFRASEGVQTIQTSGFSAPTASSFL